MGEGNLGMAVVGVGGAVGSTVAAGAELLRAGLADTVGLPLAGVEALGGESLTGYKDLVVGGWDLYSTDLAAAAFEHNVLTHRQFSIVEDRLKEVRPWRSVGNKNFLAGFSGDNLLAFETHLECIDRIRNDLREFSAGCDRVVLINLASTERIDDRAFEEFTDLDRFEAALEANSEYISPAMLYAYAALCEGVPYGNFTPSVAADLPALVRFAEHSGVPIAGKDGKTGQTFIKTVLAPALKARALRIDGWYSTNILGNRDGLALSNEESLRSKIKTKQSVLRNILGYEVEDHIVDIRYYKPRGDNKEAWDNIDFTGFLGRPMQMKVDFLCRDSVLAAPLVIEIARCLDLANRRDSGGIQEQLSAFFKMPMISSGEPVQEFHRQHDNLLRWLTGQQQSDQAR